MERVSSLQLNFVPDDTTLYRLLVWSNPAADVTRRDGRVRTAHAPEKSQARSTIAGDANGISQSPATAICCARISTKPDAFLLCTIFQLIQILA